jgi:hypothetical protein
MIHGSVIVGIHGDVSDFGQHKKSFPESIQL